MWGRSDQHDSGMNHPRGIGVDATNGNVRLNNTGQGSVNNYTQHGAVVNAFGR
jgi:hypothetical protein